MDSRHITGSGRESQKLGFMSEIGCMTRLIRVPCRQETFCFRVVPFDAFFERGFGRRVVDGNARSDIACPAQICICTTISLLGSGPQQAQRFRSILLDSVPPAYSGLPGSPQPEGSWKMRRVCTIESLQRYPEVRLCRRYTDNQDRLVRRDFPDPPPCDTNTQLERDLSTLLCRRSTQRPIPAPV